MEECVVTAEGYGAITHTHTIVTSKTESTTRPAIRKLLEQVVEDPSPVHDNKDGKNLSRNLAVVARCLISVNACVQTKVMPFSSKF